MPVRHLIAVAAIVLGTVLSATVIWNGAQFLAVMWSGAQFLRSPASSNQILIIDTYYVVVTPWTSLLIFGLGFVANIAFRRRAATFGRAASAVCRMHLLATTVLVTIALVGYALFAITRQPGLPVYAMLLVNVMQLLMLVAHGVALAAGGLVVLRSRPASSHS